METKEIEVVYFRPQVDRKLRPLIRVAALEAGVESRIWLSKILERFLKAEAKRLARSEVTV